MRSRCQHCGVTIRLIRGVWIHTWHNWQSGWCHADGKKFGPRLETRAEP